MTDPPAAYSPPTISDGNDETYPDGGTYCMLADDPTGAVLQSHGSPQAEATALGNVAISSDHRSIMMGTPTNVQQTPQETAPSAFAPSTGDHDPNTASHATLEHQALGDGTGNIGDPDLLEAAPAGYPLQPEPTETTPTATQTSEDPFSTSNRKRRICRFPNCSRVIKSQGHCQRHGAAVKRCKVDGCDKQMQGTYQGMCKRHWREATNPPNSGDPSAAPAAPPAPTGPSVYDAILPQSITYKPIEIKLPNADAIQRFEPGAPVMPLVVWLRNNAHKEFGWHRKEERLSRGCFPMTSPATRLENWERQLVLVEILLLSGGTPFANFRDLAHAWGREKNFHTTLAISVFERRGDLERKRRSDAGKPRAKRNKTAAGATATTLFPASLEQQQKREQQSDMNLQYDSHIASLHT